LRVILGAIFCLFFLIAPALAERRLALVVGNDRYDQLSDNEQLRNAVNDARAMKAVLERLDFQVDIGENLDRNQFIDKLSDFGARIQKGDIVLFFYAGHGVSFSGANYLLPRDIPKPRANSRDEENRLADHSVGESRVLDHIRPADARVAVVVLDACRDNPLAPPGGRSLGGERGLAPAPDAHGVLTIYAAGAGEKATDLGDGDSLFTSVLVKQLAMPGLGLREIAFKTQGEVAALASARGLTQEPGVYSQFFGEDVYLLAPPKAPAAQATPEAPGKAVDPVESVFWQSADKGGTADDYLAYLKRYPNGAFAALAANRLNELNAKSKSPIPPAPTPSAPAASLATPQPSPTRAPTTAPPVAEPTTRSSTAAAVRHRPVAEAKPARRVVAKASPERAAPRKNSEKPSTANTVSAGEPHDDRCAPGYRVVVRMAPYDSNFYSCMPN
jgi:hypothetical protein